MTGTNMDSEITEFVMTRPLRHEELRHLSRPSAIRSCVAILADWVLIGANFALAIRAPHAVVWLFCFLFAARQQLALAILMHDGAHHRLFRSTRLNAWVGQVLCASPLFLSMHAYRKLHLRHHRNPLAPDDPDLGLIGGYPISKASFLRKIARDALGISYFKSIPYYFGRTRVRRDAAAISKDVGSPDRGGPAERHVQPGGSLVPLWSIVVSALALNLALLVVLFSFGHGWFYFFFWILPMMTALQVLLRIRGIAEHAGYEQNSDQRLNARTVVSPLQTFLFAPHSVNYHIEHHLYPSVPFHRLRALHTVLRSRGVIPESGIFRGYPQVVRTLVRQEIP